MAPKKQKPRLADQVEQKLLAGGGPARGRQRAMFALLQDEIAEGLRRRMPMSELWKQLRDDGRTDMAYSTFVIKCRELRAEQADDGEQPSTRPASATPPSPRSRPIHDPTRGMDGLLPPKKKPLADDGGRFPREQRFDPDDPNSPAGLPPKPRETFHYNPTPDLDKLYGKDRKGR